MLRSIQSGYGCASRLVARTINFSREVGAKASSRPRTDFKESILCQSRLYLPGGNPRDRGSGRQASG